MPKHYFFFESSLLLQKPTMKTKKFLAPLLSFLLCCLLFFYLQGTENLLSAESILSQNRTRTTKGNKKMPEWIRPTSFQYSSKGKPDPFQSFIKKEAVSPQVSSGKNETKKKNTTPLSSVEPSQLKFVGTIQKLDKDQNIYGLVQLPNEKGYIIRQGTTVGQKGAKVVAIKPGKVIIHQNYTTSLGDSKTHEIILKLHKNKEGNDE